MSCGTLVARQDDEFLHAVAVVCVVFQDLAPLGFRAWRQRFVCPALAQHVDDGPQASCHRAFTETCRAWPADRGKKGFQAVVCEINPRSAGIPPVPRDFMGIGVDVMEINAGVFGKYPKLMLAICDEPAITSLTPKLQGLGDIANGGGRTIPCRRCGGGLCGDARDSPRDPRWRPELALDVAVVDLGCRFTGDVATPDSST